MNAKQSRIVLIKKIAERMAASAASASAPDQIRDTLPPGSEPALCTDLDLSAFTLEAF